MVSIHLFGGVNLQRSGVALAGPPLQRHRVALLALVAASWPQPVERDRLLALLWPERDDAAARRLLNLAVHVLRRALGDSALVSTGSALLFDPAAAWCDVQAFRAAVRDGHPERAADLHVGPFLEGFHLPASAEFDHWLDEQRTDLARAHETALQAVAAQRAETGDVAGQVAALRRLAAAAPYSGAHALALMRALDDAADRAGAVLHARQHAARLRDDLGIEPEPEIEAMAERLRVGPPRAAGLVRVRAATPPRGDLDLARMLCARGEYFCAKREPGALRKAIACFEQARTEAPAHVPAYAGLASAFAILGFYDWATPMEAFTRAREATHTALALDAGHAGSHATRAYINKYFDWQWKTAEDRFRDAVALDPSSAQIHQWFGNYLTLRGYAPEAADAMQRARRLAPTSEIAIAASGWSRYFARENDRAVEHCLESLDLDEHFAVAYVWLGFSLEELGRHDEAIAAHRRAVALAPGSAPFRASLARTLAVAGDREGARALLRELRAERRTAYVPAYEIGKVHLALDEPAAALRWLETAFRDRTHSMGYLGVDPQLTALHDHPRFRRLVRLVGLG